MDSTNFMHITETQSPIYMPLEHTFKDEVPTKSLSPFSVKYNNFEDVMQSPPKLTTDILIEQ